jgi:putative phosphoribosyl transferase
MDLNTKISIPKNDALEGILCIPERLLGLVIFVHGSGSSRFSTRNQYVAKVLNQAHIATLLFDLLTPEEEKIDAYTAEFRFDILRLNQRLQDVSNWWQRQPELAKLKLAYFGASTGAAAALFAAASLPKLIKAVV